MADSCFQPSNDVYMQMWGRDESECKGNAKDLCLESVLSGISVPVLYVTGDRDLHDLEDVRRYCAGNENIELRIMEGAAHHAGRHRDYVRTVREFIHGLDREFIRADMDNDFSEQDDYDMILSDSPHDTPGHLEYDASKMTVRECAEEARRYETGDGRPQSYLSAWIFYGRCKTEWESKWLFDRFFPFTRQYDARDAERRLILTPDGMASFCCKEMKENYMGHSYRNGFGSIQVKGERDEHDACPFCGKGLEIVKPSDAEQIWIASDGEFLRLKDRYLYGPVTIREAVSLAEALTRYSERRMEDNPYAAKERETRSRYLSILEGRIGNVTGMLTASSAGLESVCCKELSKNMKFAGYQMDHYYMRFRLKDTGEMLELKRCPYCGSRLKRIPRTY